MTRLGKRTLTNVLIKWLQSWLKRRKLIALWNEQAGKCQLCNQRSPKRVDGTFIIFSIGSTVHGQSLQLSSSPPQLSQTGAPPAVRRNEAGCGNVPEGGLSRLKGQLSRTVLRGLVGSNAHLATRLSGKR